jgi:MoxR-like ATPase
VDAHAALAAARAHVERQVLGKRDVVELALTCVLAGGHLLLEDVPGVGKTSLAIALAHALGGTFKRVQCTADLLPSDITGSLVLEGGTTAGTLRFRPGPLFANVVLADEINRASPRTQSALLEAMSEGQVSVDGQTHALPDPFLVVATQNPQETHGTFALPDAQLDRFLVRTSLGYPDRDSERAILRGASRAAARETPVVIPPGVLAALRGSVSHVHVHEELEDWVLDLVAATRACAGLARGASPRAAEALVRAACARATLHARDHVLPEDLRTLARPVLAHRLLPRDGSSAAEVLDDLLAAAPSPL